METNDIVDTTIKICQPCFEAATHFGVTDWIAVGVLGATTIVFVLTNHNLFSMSAGAYKGVTKIISLFVDLKSKGK